MLPFIENLNTELSKYQLMINMVEKMNERSMFLHLELSSEHVSHQKYSNISLLSTMNSRAKFDKNPFVQHMISN